MTYAVEISPHARRSLDKVPDADFPELDSAILALRGEPRPRGVKKLRDDIHRIRVGRWRIIYVIRDGEKLVSVLDAVRRSERTYRDL